MIYIYIYIYTHTLSLSPSFSLSPEASVAVVAWQTPGVGFAAPPMRRAQAPP